MKRDMDLVRSILFCFEESAKSRIGLKRIKLDGYSEEEIRFHIELMKESSLLDHSIVSPAARDGIPFLARIDMGIRPTMKGYDFLDSVRDEKVWAKTKEQAKKAGAGTLEFLIGIARAIVKTEIKRRTGLDVE